MRYKCTVMYDGTLFKGFQKQTNLRTVQKEIEDVLVIICKRKITIHPSGRTDTGVHSIGQVFHFDTETEMKEHNMQNALNSRLPHDIYINLVEIVDDTFHSRFSAIKKEYHYIIDFGEYNPFFRNYRYYYPYGEIDIDIIKRAAAIFIGKHDFRSFTKNRNLSDTIREIYSIEIIKTDKCLNIKIIGNGFMHNMVRIIVAMWLEVVRGKLTLEGLQGILLEKNRCFAPKIAPANGLYLYKVYY